ncbi:MAG TPA: hydroxymethylglutaryl-CoA reductase [Fibrobacteria bacterium]|nr:hydroxymethylglutaryl-CoA reductase [Fibrobacteria bacterium]HOX50649.1 hydroxymethylglutaryl-CoA reductase [Fibrobacteria bacterium]
MARSHLDIRSFRSSLPALPEPVRADPQAKISSTPPRIAALEPERDPGLCEGNVENYAGWLRVPVGIAGPLRVQGVHARGDYYVPLATTEGALVASYHRGCHAITLSGGCLASVLAEGIQRSPGFVFSNLLEAGSFSMWASHRFEAFQQEAATTTHHGKLVDLRAVVEGNHVWLILEFTTGDAAGQNMVTLAAEAVCKYILRECPIPVLRWYLEANMSGDKKACGQTFGNVRGRKVSAEVVVPRAVTRRTLGCTPEELADYWQMSAVGGVLSGSMGFQGHFANGLAALYLATGQDAACVAESAVGVTRAECTSQGDLYATVTLPDILVGTVGGGTRLPGQAACLASLNLPSEHPARALAEIAGSLCLAGELSICAAMASGNFARAHRVLSRKRPAKK